VAEVWTPPAFDNQTTGHLATAAELNAFGNSLRFISQVNYTEFTSNVNVTATTVGTANQIVSSGAHTYEAVPHRISFQCSAVQSIGADVRLILRDSTTVLGTLTILNSGASSTPIFLQRIVTPTAASHTYNVAAWLSAADTVAFVAGTGGTAGDGTTFLPGFIEIVRIPT
jgi:hypothetical protein